MNATLEKMAYGDTLVVPAGVYYMQGGIVAENKAGLTISFDGYVLRRVTLWQQQQQQQQQQLQWWHDLQQYSSTTRVTAFFYVLLAFRFVLCSF